MGKHIIVCSNNPVVVNAVSQALDHHGHRLTVCQRGLEVLGAVGVIASDLVILDLETPGLSVPLLISAINEPCAYPVYSARFAFNHTGLEARFQGFGSRMMVRSGDSRLLLPVASEGTTREQEAI